MTLKSDWESRAKIQSLINFSSMIHSIHPFSRASLTTKCCPKIWRKSTRFIKQIFRRIRTSMRDTLWTKIIRWKLHLRWFTHLLELGLVPCKGIRTTTSLLVQLVVTRTHVKTFCHQLLLRKNSCSRIWVPAKIITKIHLRNHQVRDKNLKTKPQFSTAIII